MTRRALFLALLSIPVAAAAGPPETRANTEGERSFILGPGRYTIAPGGGIRISGASDVHIQGCSIERCTFE